MLKNVILFSMFMLASAETTIPEWTKYPFFFIGAGIVASLVWTLAFCCLCPFGWKMRTLILLLGVVAIGVYAYFLFGPWWGDVITKTSSTIELQAAKGTQAANSLIP